MKSTKTRSSQPSEDVTPGDSRGVFYDLFEPDEAAELAMRSELLRALQTWLPQAGTQTAAAKCSQCLKPRTFGGRIPK